MSLPTIRPSAHHVPSQAELASWIYLILLRYRVDCAPLAWMADELRTGLEELRVAATYAPELGVCDNPALEPVVYCLPPQPMAAGFEIQYHAGHLVLRLAGREARPALLISGRQVGPAPERDALLGAGELAYTISRLTRMAACWLPRGADPTRLLFELVAEAWRYCSTHRLGGGLGVHRASFTHPVAATPVTHRIELVTHRHRGVHRLVNLYPIPERGEGMTK